MIKQWAWCIPAIKVPGTPEQARRAFGIRRVAFLVFQRGNSAALVPTITQTSPLLITRILSYEHQHRPRCVAEAVGRGGAAGAGGAFPSGAYATVAGDYACEPTGGPKGMLTQEDDVEVHALAKRGWSIAAIARHTGRDERPIDPSVPERARIGL